MVRSEIKATAGKSEQLGDGKEAASTMSKSSGSIKEEAKPILIVRFPNGAEVQVARDTEVALRILDMVFEASSKGQQGAA